MSFADVTNFFDQFLEVHSKNPLLSDFVKISKHGYLLGTDHNALMTYLSMYEECEDYPQIMSLLKEFASARRTQCEKIRNFLESQHGYTVALLSFKRIFMLIFSSTN
jgi:hypothetical protein